MLLEPGEIQEDIASEEAEVTSILMPSENNTLPPPSFPLPLVSSIPHVSLKINSQSEHDMAVADAQVTGTLMSPENNASPLPSSPAPLTSPTSRMSPEAGEIEEDKAPAGTDSSIDTEDQPKTLTEFTVFQDLPPEVRCMIWKWAEPGSRIVDATLVSDVTQPEHIPSNGCRVVSRTKPPVTLSICRESRYETQKGWKMFFKLPNQPIYLNPTLDSLDLRVLGGASHGPRLLECLDSMNRTSEIQNLVLTFYSEFWLNQPGLYFTILQSEWKNLVSTIVKFDGLKKVGIRYAVPDLRQQNTFLAVAHRRRTFRGLSRELRHHLILNPGWSLPQVIMYLVEEDTPELSELRRA